MGGTLTFLLGAMIGINPHNAAADIQPVLSAASESLAANRFDLRSVGFDWRSAAARSVPLQQFRTALLTSRPAAPQAELPVILSAADAARYGEAFAQAAAGDRAGAEQSLMLVQDPLLEGTVRAVALLNGTADYADFSGWLTRYRTLPQAEKLYALALQNRDKSDAPPAKPQSGALMHGTLTANGRGFSAQIRLDDIAGGAELAQAQTINQLLRQGKAEAAEAALRQVRQDQAFPAQWLADGEAALVALRFYAGERAPTRGLTSATVNHAPLAAWIGGLQAWKDGSYEHAAHYFTSLVGQNEVGDADRAAGYFWLGRTEQKRGNMTAARAAWGKAAQFSRCFYGQVAHAKLGGTERYSWTVPRLTRNDLNKLTQNSAGRRGLALLQLGRMNEAEAEFRRIAPRGQAGQALTLAALAQAAQLPMLALQLGSWMKTPDGKALDAALYPLPPWPVNRAVADPALVYAVMRHESGFNPQVVSAAGARGLMQLMPQTARQVDADVQTERLSEPDYNVDLGARYLSGLAQQPQIGKNLLLLVAAYNSGPGNLQRWQEANGDRDPLLFLETLPVRETRHYVQQVLSSYWMYQARLGEKTSSLQQLARGEWPQLPTPGAQSLQLASR